MMDSKTEKRVISIVAAVVYGIVIGISVFFRVMSSMDNNVDFIDLQGFAGAYMNISFALIVILVFINKSKWFDKRLGNTIILFFASGYSIPLLAMPFFIKDLFDSFINAMYIVSWFSLQISVLCISLIELLKSKTIGC